MCTVMRFVELTPDPAREGFVLPRRLAALRGLEPSERVQIVGFAHDVAMGEPSDWAGRVEIHGVRMDLDRALEMVGESAAAALVIDAGSLDVDPAEPAGTGAHRLVDAVQSEIDELAAELRSADTLRADMLARVTSAAARIDDTAGPALDAADGELHRQAATGRSVNRWAGVSDREERLVELAELTATLESRLDTLRAGDRGLLGAAVATARAALSTGDVPLPRAAALRQIWSSLQLRLAVVDSRLEAAGLGAEAASARLESAREVAAAAEAAVQPRRIDQAEADRLAALHDRLLELDGRANRGVRRGAARAQLEEVQLELTGELEAIGYPTWAAYRMGNGRVGVTDEAIAARDAAAVELEAAETAWAELMTRLEREPELQEVSAAIAQVREEAVGLIGHDPLATDREAERLADALADIRIDAANLSVNADEAIEHLRTVLADTGAPGLDGVSAPAAIVALGDSWIEVLAAADAAATRLLRDLERAGLESTSLADASGDPDGLDQPRAAVREAEAAVAATRDALLERADARLELHVLVATELALAEEHDELLERLAAARRQFAEDAHAPAADGTGAAKPLADRIPRGVGGPIPIVVVMGNASPRALDQLLALPDDVQVLVVDDAPGLEDWVARLDDEHVAVVEPGVLV